MPLTRYLPFRKKSVGESSAAPVNSTSSVSSIDWLWNHRDQNQPTQIKARRSPVDEHSSTQGRKFRWNSPLSKLPFMRWKVTEDEKKENDDTQTPNQRHVLNSSPTFIFETENNAMREGDSGRTSSKHERAKEITRDENSSKCFQITKTDSKDFGTDDDLKENSKFQRSLNEALPPMKALIDIEPLDIPSREVDLAPDLSCFQRMSESSPLIDLIPVLTNPGSLLDSNHTYPEDLLEVQMQCTVEAIEEGNTETVRQILNDYPQILSRRCGKAVFLDEETRREAFELLGQAGPLRSLTLLQLACSLGDAEIASILIDHSSLKDIDRTWGCENTALHLASFQGMPDIVEQLLNRQANPNCRNLNGYRPVDCAGDKETRAMFMKKRVDCSEIVENSTLCFQEHIDAECEATTDQVLRIRLSESPKEKQVARLKKSDNGEDYHSSRCEKELLHMILRPVDSSSDQIISECSEKDLLISTVKVPSSSSLDVTATRHAADDDHQSIPTNSNGITRFESSISKRVHFDENLLFLDCVRNGELIEISNYLDNRKIDINVRNSNGLNALHLACRHGHPELVKTLLLNGLDVNSRDSENWTPLHFAVFEDYVDIVQGLLAYHPDISIEDNEGKSAMDLANGLQIKRLLSDYMSISSTSSRSNNLVDRSDTTTSSTGQVG